MRILCNYPGRSLCQPSQSHCWAPSSDNRQSKAVQAPSDSYTLRVQDVSHLCSKPPPGRSLRPDRWRQSMQGNHQPGYLSCRSRSKLRHDQRRDYTANNAHVFSIHYFSVTGASRSSRAIRRGRTWCISSRGESRGPMTRVARTDRRPQCLLFDIALPSDDAEGQGTSEFTTPVYKVPGKDEWSVEKPFGRSCVATRDSVGELG